MVGSHSYPNCRQFVSGHEAHGEGGGEGGGEGTFVFIDYNIKGEGVLF